MIGGITDKKFIERWLTPTKSNMDFFEFCRCWMIFNRLYTATPQKNKQYEEFFKKNPNLEIKQENKDSEKQKISNFIIYCFKVFFEKKENIMFLIVSPDGLLILKFKLEQIIERLINIVG